MALGRPLFSERLKLLQQLARRDESSKTIAEIPAGMAIGPGGLTEIVRAYIDVGQRPLSGDEVQAVLLRKKIRA